MTDLTNTKTFMNLLFYEAFRKIGMYRLLKNKYSKLILVCAFALGYAAYFYVNMKLFPKGVEIPSEAYLGLISSYITTILICSLATIILVTTLFRVSDTIYYVVNTFPIERRQVAIGIMLFKLILSSVGFLLVAVIIWTALVAIYSDVFIIFLLLILGLSIHIATFFGLSIIEELINRCFSRLRDTVKTIVLLSVILLTIYSKFRLDSQISWMLKDYVFSESSFSTKIIVLLILVFFVIGALLGLMIFKIATVSKYYKRNKYVSVRIPIKVKRIRLFKKVHLALIREKMILLPVSLTIISVGISVLMMAPLVEIKGSFLSSLVGFSIMYLYYINSTSHERIFDRLYKINVIIEVLYLQVFMVIVGLIMHIGDWNGFFGYLYVCNSFLFSGLLFPKSKSTINELLGLLLVVFMFAGYSILNQQNNTIVIMFVVGLVIVTNMEMFKKLSTNS